MKNNYCLSIDLEEYFHAANLEPYYGQDSWMSLESRVISSTEKLLELFDTTNTKVTFFCLGWVAKREPELIKKICEQGHEIASHGYGHKIVYQQSEAEFFEDISDSKKLLEDITSSEIRGYRAPNFSITDKSPWAYDRLREAGYLYDSSLYPVAHPRYKNTGRKHTPHCIETKRGKIIEYPLATAPLGIRFPIAGGAYWRLFPFWFTRWGLRLASQESSECNKELSPCCYLHPWEIDTQQPLPKNINPVTRLRHFGGTGSLLRNLDFLLKENHFQPIWNAIEQNHQDLLVEQNNKITKEEFMSK